jgi:hypothetical protein
MGCYNESKDLEIELPLEALHARSRLFMAMLTGKYC